MFLLRESLGSAQGWFAVFVGHMGWILGLLVSKHLPEKPTSLAVVLAGWVPNRQSALEFQLTVLEQLSFQGSVQVQAEVEVQRVGPTAAPAKTKRPAYLS